MLRLCFYTNMNLPSNYFLQNDVVFIAKDLLGKYLFTTIDGQIAGGIITETEAYKGTDDKASHAYHGRRTPRNEMMYHEGGVIYVYQCYGIHYMLNFVTNRKDIPDAILIRGIFPTHGGELMLCRTGKAKLNANLTDGPGKVAKALGINKSHNGLSLSSPTIWVEDRQLVIPEKAITNTPRIGVDYAGEDALLPYRFVIAQATDLLANR